MEEVTIKGLREMREALVRKIPLEMHSKVIQSALMQGGKIVVAAAKARAPSRTGILKASIYQRKDAQGSTATYHNRVIAVRAKRGGWRVKGKEKRRGKSYTDKNRGSGAKYWWHVEFGTKHMGAQPFMVPAFEQTARGMNAPAVRAIVEGLQNAMVDAIRKARW